MRTPAGDRHNAYIQEQIEAQKAAREAIPILEKRHREIEKHPEQWVQEHQAEVLASPAVQRAEEFERQRLERLGVLKKPILPDEVFKGLGFGKRTLQIENWRAAEVMRPELSTEIENLKRDIDYRQERLELLELAEAYAEMKHPKKAVVDEVSQPLTQIELDINRQQETSGELTEEKLARALAAAKATKTPAYPAIGFNASKAKHNSI